MKSLWIALWMVLLALLAGCGTPYATVTDGAGRPVMLLGHDPVAYFTQGYGSEKRSRVWIVKTKSGWMQCQLPEISAKCVSLTSLPISAVQ